MGPDGLPDPDFWGNLLDVAKTAGPFGTVLMLAMWWLERRERLATRDLYDKLLREMLTTMNAGTSALEKFSDILSRKRSS